MVILSFCLILFGKEGKVYTSLLYYYLLCSNSSLGKVFSSLLWEKIKRKVLSIGWLDGKLDNQRSKVPFYKSFIKFSKVENVKHNAKFARTKLCNGSLNIISSKSKNVMKVR